MKSGIAKGGSPLPGSGVSPQKLFFLLLRAAAGGTEKLAQLVRQNR